MRRLAYNFEDVLSSDYSQANVFSVADEADPQLPRIAFASKHGFSQIYISQVNLSLIVNYSRDEWAFDHHRRSSYLLPRIERLFDLLRLMPGVDAAYSGVTHNYWIDSLLSDLDIIERLQKFYFGKVDAALDDVIIRFSHVVADRFYSNVVVQTSREWPHIDPLSMARLPKASAVRRGIAIEHDLNDRFAYNEIPEFHSSMDSASKMMEVVNRIDSDVLGAVSEALNG